MIHHKNTPTRSCSYRHSAWFLLAVPLLFLVLTFLWPTTEAIRMSLRDYTHNLYAPEWVGLRNYAAVLYSPDFHQALANSLLLLLLVMPGVVIISTLMALAFAGQ